MTCFFSKRFNEWNNISLYSGPDGGQAIIPRQWIEEESVFPDKESAITLDLDDALLLRVPQEYQGKKRGGYFSTTTNFSVQTVLDRQQKPFVFSEASDALEKRLAKAEYYRRATNAGWSSVVLFLLWLILRNIKSKHGDEEADPI